MLANLGSHLRSNVVAYLALVVALGGGTAYAADTIGSDDVIDESLLSEDVKNGTLTKAKVASSTLNGTTVLDGSLSFHDLAPGTIVNSRLADGAVNSAKVANESLAAADVDEDTLLNANIVARPRQIGAAVASTGFTNTEVNIPRTAGTWAQGPTEVQQLVVQADISGPNTFCQDPGPPITIRNGLLRLKINGQEVGRLLLGGIAASPQSFSLTASIPSTGAAESNTFTATISDDCPTADWSVANLKVDVLGAR